MGMSGKLNWNQSSKNSQKLYAFTSAHEYEHNNFLRACSRCCGIHWNLLSSLRVITRKESLEWMVFPQCKYF